MAFLLAVALSSLFLQAVLRLTIPLPTARLAGSITLLVAMTVFFVAACLFYAFPTQYAVMQGFDG